MFYIFLLLLYFSPILAQNPIYDRDYLMEAHSILDTYAFKIRTKELEKSSILAESFQMTHCNSSIVLPRGKFIEHLSKIGTSISTRPFLIQNVYLNTEKVIKSFTAFIHPFISINEYHVKSLGSPGKYEITSEIHRNCNWNPLSTSLIDDQQLVAGIVRNLFIDYLEVRKHKDLKVLEANVISPQFRSIDCHGIEYRYEELDSFSIESWEIYDVFLNESLIFWINSTKDSTIYQYSSDYDGKHRIFEEKCVVPEQPPQNKIVNLYRIVEFTGSRAIFDELFADQITFRTKNGDGFPYHEDVYYRILNNSYYRFEEPVTTRNLEVFEDGSFEFILKNNRDCEKRIRVNNDSKIDLEDYLTWNPNEMQKIHNDVGDRHKQAEITALAENIIIKFYEAIKTQDTEMLQKMIGKNGFKIQMSLNSKGAFHLTNPIDIFNSYSKKFSYPTVIGAHKFENGSLFMRVIGTGYHHYYQTVFEDGVHFMEYEMREKPVIGGNYNLTEFLNYL